MLKKQHRLPIQDFARARGKTVSTTYFTLRIFPKREKISRLGVIISSKTSKSSVKRNQLRRMAFACFSELRDKLPPGDFLLNILSGAAKLEKAEFKEECNNVFKKTVV